MNGTLSNMTYPALSGNPDGSAIFALFNFKLNVVFFGFVEKWMDLINLYTNPLKQRILKVESLQEIYNKSDHDDWYVNHLYFYDEKDNKNLASKIFIFLQYCKHIKSVYIMKEEHDEYVPKFEMINYIKLKGLTREELSKGMDKGRTIITDYILTPKNIYLTFNRLGTSLF
jgi:hypothetical protein